MNVFSARRDENLSVEDAGQDACVHFAVVVRLSVEGADLYACDRVRL
ncbi:MAG: hypothetical protein AB7K04_04970 [Pseudorhodoplanes sp.]